MADKTDIILFGTGAFAARIAFDLAATATHPLNVTIAGRNAERLDWLKTAANARAVIFERPARFEARRADLSAEDDAADLIARLEPGVVVQAASPLPSSIIATSGNAWSSLIAEAGLSIMAVPWVMFSVRAARAVSSARPGCHFINCSYPDVNNSLIAALDLPITCGTGNVSILASVFAAALEAHEPGRLKTLVHYQCVTAFRKPAAGRTGPMPRVWVDGAEVDDVFEATRDVKLTPEPVIDVSGAGGVPLIQALVSGERWEGHAPAPFGLPGGYPVACSGGELQLALPAGLGRDEAVAWNAAFEREHGLYVDEDGNARFTGILHDRLKAHSPDLAAGFAVRDIDAVYEAFIELQAKLIEAPAG